MNARDAWQNILDPGERIVWQGHPDTAVAIKPRNYLLLGFALFFTSFAVIWMILAAQAGGFFWTFGLIHFAVGSGLIWASLFWGSYRRKRTWYTLSDRRAFIATELPIRGRSLRSFPITDTTMLEFEDGNPASIFFAQETRLSRHRNYTVPIGFERIADGPAVYKLMRDVQTGAA